MPFGDLKADPSTRCLVLGGRVVAIKSAMESGSWYILRSAPFFIVRSQAHPRKQINLGWCL